MISCVKLSQVSFKSVREEISRHACYVLTDALRLLLATEAEAFHHVDERSLPLVLAVWIGHRVQNLRRT